ncbi:MAG: TorF family putative porin, partial [Hyphomicrobium sp.]
MVSSSKLLGAVAAAGLALGAVSGSAAADDKFGYSWTITGASDYLFRGISYTQTDPTVNSYLEFTYDTSSAFGTAYVAFWTSNIDIPDYA